MQWKGLVCLLLLALAGPGSVCAVEEAPLLQVGVPVTRELHGGEVHSYRLPLNAGDYAHIEVVQQGIDVAITTHAPAGAQLDNFDSSIGSYSTEFVALIAEETGEFRIVVRPYLREATGSYRLTLKALRPAKREDRLLTEAERADTKAFQGLDNALLAVERWREVGDRQGEAWALIRLARQQGSSRQYQGCLASAEQALDLHRQSGDRYGMAESLILIGQSNRLLGHKQEALAAHKESIALWEQLQNPDRLIKALLEAGETNEALNEFAEALALYERALTLSRQIGSRVMEAFALSDLGQIHRRLGEPKIALEELRSALDLARALNLKNPEADVRTKLGTLYSGQGRFQDAIDQYTSVLQMYRKPGEEPRQCVPRANLGGVFFQLGSFETARELLREALPLCLESQSRAVALVVLSRVEEQLKLFKDAAAHLDEALKLQQSVNNTQGEAETLRAQGILFLGTREPAKARDRLLKSVALLDRLGLRSPAIAARRSLARAEADLGNFDSARRGFEEALGQAKALDDISEQALLHAEAGRLESKTGHFQDALGHLESAQKLFESFRSEINADGLRARHFATVRETYESYIDALLQLHRSAPESGLVDQAFVTAERSRARGLLDVLTRARIDTNQNPELKSEELGLREELSAKVRARSELPPGSRADALLDEIKALSAQQEVLGAMLARESNYAELTQPLTSQEAQGLLDDGTALLEYILAEPRSYAWVVTRESLTVRELPGRSQIEALARQAHEALSTPSERDISGQRSVLALLSQNLLQPLLPGLEGKRLAVVGDGPLQYVPFAALPVSSAPTGPLLIDEHEVVMLPSAAVLREIRRTETLRPSRPMSLAIFADPVYLGDTPAPLTASPVLPATLRGAGLERLSWSRREADQIAAEAEGHTILKALDYGATRELALSDRLADFRIIHFATHGIVDSDNPSLSRLALSEIDRSGRKLDGNLFLEDLYSLHLKADLVVLSACESGLGRDLRGEGLLGMTHGFLHAGASQVISSLWPVRDRAAAELMQRLYRAMLHDGMHPSAALRTAQLEMRGQRIWRNPYFWAAFVAQGDWQAGADRADTADTATTP